MYVVLYDQAGRLSFDKRISAKQLKNNLNDIRLKVNLIARFRL